MLRWFVRIAGFFFAWGALGLALGAGTLYGVVHVYGRDLPDTAVLAAYEPATLSRVYSGEGLLLDEFARERRIFTPADEIPALVKQAFVSAEDKNFYTHPGFDLLGIAKALYDAAQGSRLRGASTITQQVMKNFLLDGERSTERKIKEIILAVRLESTFTKDQILELYLNEIFLGQNAYGVTAAAQVYFNKTLEELTPGEVAYLAALPKEPSELHPVRQHDEAVQRRNYVLKEMAENGYITAEVAAAEAGKPLLTVQSGDIVSARTALPPRDYFTEEIRRQLSLRLSEDKLFGGGLSIRATIDPGLQAAAEKALRKRLEKWDRDHGKWRGPLDRLAEPDLKDEATWRAKMAVRSLPRDIDGWKPAVVLEVDKTGARIGIEGVAEAEEPHRLSLKDAAWTGRKKAEDLWARGDIILVAEQRDKDGKPTGAWSLRQVPELQGAIMAMDPLTGRVLALQGGFSYQSSVFNRATQATRQPGSSFKPFVYAAALDHGFNPGTIVLDAPVVVETGAGLWTPQNASNDFLGPVPMRVGIERSRNLMTIRIAQDLGMDVVAEYAERFGVYDDMPEHLSYSLGAGETTLWKMVAAYGMFANGGLKLDPTLVDRVQDRRGRTIYRHDERVCADCTDPLSAEAPEPWVVDRSARVMDAVTAYQLTAMMRGVVTKGTAAKAFSGLKLAVAGKTGTTNDSKDVWFIGFTPNLVIGCYIGYDTPRPMGKGASGGELCAPAVREVFEAAMKDRPALDFRPPEGTVFVKMDASSGVRLADDASGPGVVTELFRAGEEPGVGVATDVIVGDAGSFTYGNDLPLITADEGGTYVLDPVNPGDAPAPPPPSSQQLSVGSGGLY